MAAIWSWDERAQLRYLRQGDLVVVCVAHCPSPTRQDVETYDASLGNAVPIRVRTLQPLDAQTGKDGSDLHTSRCWSGERWPGAHRRVRPPKHRSSSRGRKDGGRTASTRLPKT